eukprot:1857867-Pleurochrysis_carterae.AAC.1
MFDCESLPRHLLWPTATIRLASKMLVLPHEEEKPAAVSLGQESGTLLSRQAHGHVKKCCDAFVALILLPATRRGDIGSRLHWSLWGRRKQIPVNGVKHAWPDPAKAIRVILCATGLQTSNLQ